MRVLVVDDSAVIRALATYGLADVAGWQVVEADSGPEALRMAATESPEAILLDVVMPGMDGTETLSELRAGAGTREIPVIFVTAKDDPADHERFERLGAAGVIAKPFEVAQLAGQVTAILERAR
jgi:DNA-binding response OmpR family regulator